MRRGLVLGKFMPIHKGHIKLIEYAAARCDALIVWICVSNKEAMSADLRLDWVTRIFKDNAKIKPVLFEYDEAELPNTSESSKEVSRIWAAPIKQNLPKIDVLFSTEKYGDYLADYLGIEHDFYPMPKAISASLIRNNPYNSWEYIPDVVKPHFYCKIGLLGTESTGKSTLTKKLASYFNGDYVSEAGRELVDNTNACQANDLLRIAESHASKIISSESNLNRMLFIDTDINITKSYSRFLFGQKLVVDKRIENANKCDLYLYLENDVPFVQDGTRLSETDRNRLNESHKKELADAGVNYKVIKGNWHTRFQLAVKIIHDYLNGNMHS